MANLIFFQPLAVSLYPLPQIVMARVHQNLTRQRGKCREISPTITNAQRCCAGEVVTQGPSRISLANASGFDRVTITSFQIKLEPSSPWPSPSAAPNRLATSSLGSR